jgi:hypothetical protein
LSATSRTGVQNCSDYLSTQGKVAYHFRVSSLFEKKRIFFILFLLSLSLSLSVSLLAKEEINLLSSLDQNKKRRRFFRFHFQRSLLSSPEQFHG